MRKKKGFTLIELIAVLVILAIIALIATALVMNIVKKSKNSANKRSVDGYGKAIELSIADYLMHTGTYPSSVDELEVNYTGNKIECGEKRINNDGSVYLSVCSVDGVKVTDSKTDDGYYHYGKKISINSDYVDLYGKALEVAISEYINKNGELPTDISGLSIDSLEKEVKCDYEINSDGTVYLTNCSVDGTKVEDSSTKDGYYHYGTNKDQSKIYKIGDIVTYNGIKFYVIEDSDSSSNYVKLLKAESLTTSEITSLGSFTVVDSDGYGTVKYGSDSNYTTSTVKKIIDAWILSIGAENDLKIDDSGYSSRLLNNEDLLDNLGYSANFDGTYNTLKRINAPKWVYNSSYWIDVNLDDNTKRVYYIGDSESLSYVSLENSNYYTVRPVINLLKSAIED